MGLVFGPVSSAKLVFPPVSPPSRKKYCGVPPALRPAARYRSWCTSVYGSFGYGYILRHFVLRLRRLGVSKDEITKLLESNPRRVFEDAARI